MRIHVSLLVCGLSLAASAVATAQDSTPASKPSTVASTQPAIRVVASDKAAVAAAVDKSVILTGEVESAAWSSTGRMMIIHFKDSPENFRAVAYQKQREALDKAFGGDLAGAISGKKVELTGRVRKYAGTNEAWKDVIELPVTRPEQVKVLDAGAK